MSNSVPFFFLFVVFKLAAVSAYMVADLVYSYIGTLAEQEKQNCLLGNFEQSDCSENIGMVTYFPSTKQILKTSGFMLMKCKIRV